MVGSGSDTASRGCQSDKYHQGPEASPSEVRSGQARMEGIF